MNKSKTVKKSKSVYIIGSITIGIIALLAVYLILIATGVISAEPIRITVSTESAVSEYDGEKLTADGWELSDGKLKDGHTLKVTVTGGQTEAGASKNTAVATVLDEKGYDVTDSYKITFDAGTLEVTPRMIVVRSASAEKIYDGTPLTADSCSLAEGKLLAGHEIKYSVNGTLTGSGKTNNTFVATVTDGARDVSHNYNINYLYGTLYVHGEKLEILTHTAQKTYDGAALTCDKWTLSSGVLRNGDKLSVTVLGSQTEVGTSQNIASCVVTNASGENVTDYYEPVFTYGTLTVEPIIILIETRPAYKVYDGTPLASDGWRVVTDDTLATDDWNASGDSVTVGEYTVTANVVGSRTDVGISDNNVSGVSVMSNGQVADWVEVRYKLGLLNVTARNLTVKSGTASKPFDGTPLTCDEYEVVSMTKVADGQTLTVIISGTATFVGTVANTIAEVIIKDQNGEDVTRNYNIKLQEGQLAILGDDGGTGGNEGGDGSGDLGDDGSLGGDEQGEPKLALKLRSDRDGEVYLRYKSFGAYNGGGFDEAAEYGGTGLGDGLGMNYLTGAALAAAGYEYYRAELELVNTSQYFLPYYLSVEQLGSTPQASDVVYTGNQSVYAAYYYAYNYIADGGAATEGVALGSLSAAELAYRAFVYAEYCGLPDFTREYVDKLIADNGFADLPLAQKISAVANYVRNAAKYNKKYDVALDAEADVAVAFLDRYKEGVCRHYAAAATVIFRALGIPSRYVIGYTAQAKNGEWVEVTTDKAHAWTEVYIDGAGWVFIEVTGGGAGFDGTGGSGSTGIGNPDSDKKLNIKPFDVYLNVADFDGSPLTYTLDRLQGLSDLEAAGCRYEFAVEGSQSKVGIGESKITEFKLIDGYGNDVTDEYNITLSTGKLHIYVQEITVRTESLDKVYDGVALCSAEGEGYSCVGTMLDGHSIASIVMTGSRKNVGRSANTFELTVTDASGADVTYMYKVNSELGVLRVTARTITVTAESAVGYYNELNGAALVCGEYTVTGEDGGLADGDDATVTIRGEQSVIGRSENTVEKVVINNADGEDVTSNYVIKCVSGTLTVVPRRPANTAEEVL